MPHRNGDAIHVLDLGNDLFRRSTKTDVPSLVGESAVATALQVLRRQLSGDFHRLGDRAARDSPVIRDAHLIAGWIAEPQPADVLDTVVSQTKCNSILLAVDRNGADRVLCNSGV